MEHHSITVDPAKCVGCGLCVKVCVARHIALEHKTARVGPGDCLLCGQCTAVCPREAVSIGGYAPEPPAPRREVRLEPDDVLDVIRFRRTIRRFQPRAIPPDTLGRILEAGRLTHTAKNRQDVSFVVLDREKDRVERMAVGLFRILRPFAALFSPMARDHPIDDHFFFFRAPIVLVVLAKDKTNGLLAAQNMEFVAEASGLGVLYSGFFTMAANASRRIRKVLGVPKGKRVAMTLVLGYPDVKFLRGTPHRELDVTYR